MGDNIIRFEDLGLSEELLGAIKNMGFEEPTPIQAKTIPPLLSGRDLIGQAQTGTGKTAAFGIPIVESVSRATPGVQAIILTPTRELAIQVAEEINKLGRTMRVHALPVYGGTSIERQIKILERGVHVVVGTPGRVIDHLSRKTLDLSTVRFFVLDEADEMLDMGFIDDIRKILNQAPKEKQTMLFSATMSPEILKIAKRYMNSPENVRVDARSLTASKVNQVFFEVRESEKLDALTRLIDSDAEGVFLVFCHTKQEVDEVTSHLKMRGYDAEAIHGDFDQFRREAVLRKFVREAIDVLVATDVAARGLDISNITHVVNYSIPQNPEAYVHRIGRTGRAGREGMAITFVTPREEKQLRLIKKVSRAEIKRGRLPSEEEVRENRLANLKDKAHEFIDDERFTTFLDLARDFVSDMAEPLEAVAALLKFHLEGVQNEAERMADPALDETGAPPGMSRLFITIGREQGMTAHDIVETISDKAGLPAKAIKGVNIFDNFAFVEVPRSNAEKIIKIMHRSVISGRKVVVAPARPRQESFGRANPPAAARGNWSKGHGMRR